MKNSEESEFFPKNRIKGATLLILTLIQLHNPESNPIWCEFMLCICFLPAVYYYVLLCICTCIYVEYYVYMYI